MGTNQPDTYGERIAGVYWSSWDRAAFTADSTRHISVYELAG